MKQVLAQLKSGEVSLAEVPAPGPAPGAVRIATRASVISAGTERMLVEFGRASLLRKARSQPDRVRDVLDKLRADGVLPTLEAVFRKLDEPIPLGYCNAGVVLEGGGAFEPGDRVASNGPHAEIVSVPANLCARIPAGVTDEQAAFTALGSIALQGIRLAAPSFGETVVVIGLGLVGQLAVQLLRANGAEVLGIDLRESRLAMAGAQGARVIDARSTDPVAAVLAATGGAGADAVLVAASAEGDDIMHQAAGMCRPRGRIVLVGVVGLNLRRDDFYRKEITFQVSCSYGPGRYDAAYEEGGRDYPLPYVRWTEQRNFQAVLVAMADGRLDVTPLITHRMELARAAEAYERLSADGEAVGIVLRYPAADGAPSPPARTVRLSPTARAGRASGEEAPAVGVIGTGAFARSVLLPALARTGVRLAWAASRSGGGAAQAARRFGIERATTDAAEVLADPSVSGVVIATRHDAHARLVCEALRADKHVFVEKPLCLTRDELAEVRKAVGERPDRVLMVGFNRRWSIHARRLHGWMSQRQGPVAMVATINAGALPAGHWTTGPEGGGRILGEVCHFVDLLVYLAGGPVRGVIARRSGGPDDVSAVLSFEDGSTGTIHYFTGGARGYPKEEVRVFSEGRVLELLNFRATRRTGGGPGIRAHRSWRQDKGHAAEMAAFAGAMRSGVSPVPFEELANVTLATIGVAEAAGSGNEVAVV